MKITGMVHCMFEQSGTFKNEFRKFGIHAEDYDIQNNFGETDHVMDLFAEIEAAYERERDGIRQNNERRPDHSILPLHILLCAKSDELYLGMYQLSVHDS